jgi:cbb3-type cytochrome oxidase cytochrome c subunit
MTQNQKDNGQGKALPIKSITIIISLIFFVFVVGFMIMPAYFDQTPFGKIFHNESAPWAISKESQKKFNYTETELKGRQHYIEYCSSCHGPNGKGDGPSSVTLKKRPPNFISFSEKYINEFNKKGLLKTINEGVPNTEMPSFQYLPKETKEQITEFLLYIKKHPNFY